ncbi:MAG: response regulator transcription factor [Desulfobacteraceae bacterium]|jgi:sigma-B regulation protein RsbU (phosphoserine phosphatase)
MERHIHDEHVEQSKILYIDDDAELVSIYIRFFEDSGYAFRTALNAEKGYEEAVSFLPDLIICDVLLPGMNGIELCRKIKAVSRLCDVIFMLVTGMEVDSEDMVEGFRAGADEYLMKPFSKDEILARVNSLMRIKQLRDKLSMAERQISTLSEELEKTKSIIDN